ncbi:hypothetical protein D915_010291 [Fasciola hepatica]|uniref:Uncharacterized protein n=1 Tax=Fasciola hepatica TaxID=6192 RepID=A0A4E0RCD0_FASHE|nr:hypothetical protein D915_010291 [Fasciola hepatica]
MRGGIKWPGVHLHIHNIALELAILLFVAAHMNQSNLVVYSHPSLETQITPCCISISAVHPVQMFLCGNR